MSNVTVQEALKAAMEALTSTSFKETIFSHDYGYVDAFEQADKVKFDEALEQCKAALAEIEKCEPVGEVVMVHDPEWMKPHEGFKWYQTEFPLGTKFYISPISKSWVSLTYDQKMDLKENNDWYNFPSDLIEATEAKLKQLNTEG